MSEQLPEVPSTRNRLIVPLAAFVAIALVGAGLYVMFAPSGKSEETALDASDSEHRCNLTEAQRARLDAASKGEMAAFSAVDQSISLASLPFDDRDGNKTSIADWKGRTILVNLWATWCAPCRKEMPALDALEKELGGEAFQVVPISLDLGDAQKPKAFYEQIGLQNLPFFHDGSLQTLKVLKKEGLAFGLPATLLIDEHGCVTGRLNGPAEWASDDAKALIKASMSSETGS